MSPPTDRFGDTLRTLFKTFCTHFGEVGLPAAVITSWNANHNWGWVIVHSLFGWAYVFYHWMFA